MKHINPEFDIKDSENLIVNLFLIKFNTMLIKVFVKDI